MREAATAEARRVRPGQPGPGRTESVLPELREMWWVRTGVVAATPGRIASRPPPAAPSPTT
ncbi:hypothetical protein ABZ749_09520 [Micromonospora sp. NPDC047753]|uniref:hypothetical protein n=1 Tax=Micromonospora sp. NPDC047753 TaxID=3154817 RepID=UPI00340F42F3